MQEKKNFDEEFEKIVDILRLPEIIKSLEGADLTIRRQRDLIKEAKRLITDEDFLVRFDNIFRTNPDLDFLINYSVSGKRRKILFIRPSNNLLGRAQLFSYENHSVRSKKHERGNTKSII
jgi:hypothetical protein